MHLTQPLHRALQQHPDKIATIYGARTKTFRALGARISQLAGGLCSLGMGWGDRVAMLALNSDRYLEFLVAVPWGGGAVNPCNTRLNVEELLYSLEDSGSKILLVDEFHVAHGSELLHRCESLEAVIYVGDDAAPDGMISYEELIENSAPIADALRRGDDLLGLFYTGGTTGMPKGVMLSHLNFMSSCFAYLSAGIGKPGGIFLHAAPMFHLADLAMGSVTWIVGNTHSFIPGFSVEAVIEAIERDNVSETLLVPTMIQMLVDSPFLTPGRDLSSLKTIIYGGSSISEPVLQRAFDALPGISFFQSYGMTELSPAATVLPPFFHTRAGQELGKLRSAGRAALCTRIRIVDPGGLDLPNGERGEIIVQGPNVMQGYWNKPAETAAALREGWMLTGDVGFIDDDGFVFVVDRLKDMIISGGENIYSAEIENVLAAHPAVQACAVIGVPSEQWGESVHAFIVMKPGVAVTHDALLAHCRQLIAGYKCPRSIDVVGELPLSGPGKVLKTELRKQYVAGRR